MDKFKVRCVLHYSMHGFSTGWQAIDCCRRESSNTGAVFDDRPSAWQALAVFRLLVILTICMVIHHRVHSDTKEYRKDKLSNYSSQVSHGPTDAIMT